MGTLDKIQFWKKKDDDPFGSLGKSDAPPAAKPFDFGFGGQTQGSSTLSDHSMDSGMSVSQPTRDAFSAPMGSSLHQEQQHGQGFDPTSAYAPTHDPGGYPPVHAGYERQPQSPNVESDLLRKEIEIISTKLDYLKATLESINRRLENIEHTTKYEYGENSRRY